MTTTTNYNLPLEDARYLSLEAMVKVAFERIDQALADLQDQIDAIDARVTALETP